MPESGASGQGHGLSERTGPFYAHAVHASTFRQRSLPLGASNSAAQGQWRRAVVVAAVAVVVVLVVVVRRALRPR